MIKGESKVDNKLLFRKCLQIGIILLLMSNGIIPVTVQYTEKSLPTSRGNWLYVGGNGQGNYTKIQDAIDNASDEDTVFVYNGIYNENVIINKTINLIGENKDTTIIEGGGYKDVLFISSDGVTISGFTMQNSGSMWPDSGIRIYYSNSTKIIDNIISNSYDGIQLFFSCSTTIMANNVFNNNRSIVLTCSNNNVVMSNNASNNVNGIVVDFSSNNNVTGNNVNSNNKRGIILTTSSNDNVISGNNVLDNYWGIYLSYSSNNIIEGNNVSHNYHGMCLYHLSNNNNCYHNNFMNNTQNVYDEFNTTWDNGYPSCGNYWDDYNGTDANGDSVGDTPYFILGGNSKDLFPLMEPYGMTTLSLDFKSGLFRWSGVIKNIGNTTAFAVQWKLRVDGDIVLVGRESSGMLVKSLRAREETYVNSNLVLGLGKINISMAVWADNAPYISKSTPGTLILFFVLI